MPKKTISVEMPAPCEDVFDLLHDYSQRLRWDTMLSDARLLDGAATAAAGVRALCTGTWRTGFLAMETEYVRFTRGKVAAVRMTNHPRLFAKFAATIRHDPVGDRRSRLTYIYSFEARPRMLAWLVGPVVNLLLGRETRLRLHALRRFLERTAA